MTRRPTLFVMVGLPGAGKTTLAKRLEREHDALRLTKDDWLMALFGRADLDRERQVVEDLLWTMGARALSLGVDVVLDYGLWARAERDDYRARAAALGARVDLRFLDVSEEELRRRLAERALRGDPADVPISAEQLAGYLPRFERPGDDEVQDAAPTMVDVSSISEEDIPMTRITVLGGTGYAGAAIVAEAARRGHEVTSVSRSRPAAPVAGVTVVQGDVADEGVLASAVEGAEVVVGALAPRGPLAETFRDTYRTAAGLADAAGARFVVVGGFSSLRPAPGADRYVTDLSHTPEAVRAEVLAGAALILEDMPATPESLDWLFVSPPLGFGSHAPIAPTGAYRQGGEVAVDPTGGAISAEDYAQGVVDLIEQGGHRREQVNLAV